MSKPQISLSTHLLLQPALITQQLHAHCISSIKTNIKQAFGGHYFGLSFQTSTEYAAKTTK